MRNFKKAMVGVAQFVDKWQDCDIFLIVGVTITNPAEVIEAKKAGKHVVFRVDNIPKKSRNRRCTPYERVKEFAELSELVIYQSKWAEQYCKPLAGEGTVIYNGVDTKLFYPAEQRPDRDIYLFAYHGHSELKGFWIAHHYFQMQHRKNPKAEFWFINDFKRDLQELQFSRFDFWNDEPYRHIKNQSEQGMAKLMRECTHLIFPSVADASPNTVLEAKASGLQVVGYARADMSGTQELVDLPMEEIGLERMAEEYTGVLKVVMQSV